MAEHPPTDAQIERNGDKARPLDFDVDTFPPALIAESIVKVVYTGDDPEEIAGADLDADAVAEMLRDPGWSSTDKDILFGLCRGLTEAHAIVSRDLVERLGKG